jgi:hypothetical protein
MREQIVPLDHVLLDHGVASSHHTLSSREETRSTSCFLVQLGYEAKGCFRNRSIAVGYCGLLDLESLRSISIFLRQLLGTTIGRQSTSRVPPRKGKGSVP